MDTRLEQEDRPVVYFHPDVKVTLTLQLCQAQLRRERFRMWVDVYHSNSWGGGGDIPLNQADGWSDSICRSPGQSPATSNGVRWMHSAEAKPQMAESC